MSKKIGLMKPENAFQSLLTESNGKSDFVARCKIKAKALEQMYKENHGLTVNLYSKFNHGSLWV